MEFGLGILKLSPEQFWSLSLPEAQAAAAGFYGTRESLNPLSRADLDDLMQRFPDLEG